MKHPEYLAANSRYMRELAGVNRENRAAITGAKAINQGSPWTEAEIHIALDASRSTTEAALMLGRTAHAVEIKRSKVKRQGVIDPRATNNGDRWTQSEAAIAADPELSLTEAAFTLGRSLKATDLRRTHVRSGPHPKALPRPSLVQMVDAQDTHGVTEWMRQRSETAQGEGCWNWAGRLDKKDHRPVVTVHLDGKAKRRYAHRMAYLGVHGPIPPDQHVRLSCCNKLCVNPEHLTLSR